MRVLTTRKRVMQHTTLIGVVAVLGSAAFLTAQTSQVQATLPDGTRVTLNVSAGGSREELIEQLNTRFSGLSTNAELLDKIAGITGAPGDQQALPPPSTARLQTGTSRISGRILSNSGQPLRQATVRVSAPELNGSKTVTTDTEGRYEVIDLPAGRYTVNAMQANYIPLNYGQRRPNEISKIVDLADKQRADRIDITLPRGGVLTGRVLDEYGEPVTDAQVVPMQRRMSQGQLRLMGSGRMALTNDIGEFRIFGLPPGQYYISSTLRGVPSPLDSPTGRFGYAPTYYPSTPLPANAQPITLGLSETVNGLDLSLTATRLASVSGSALDSRGLPLYPGNVVATDRNGNTSNSSTAVLRSDGSFVLSGLAPGDYVLRASVAGAPASPLTVQSKLNGATNTMTIALPSGSEVLVATVSVNGSDISGVQLAPLKRITLSGRITFDRAAGNTLRSDMLRIAASPGSPEAVIGMAGLGNAVILRDFSFQYAAAAAELTLRAFVQHPDWVVKAISVGGLDITDTGVDLRAGRDVDGIEVELTNRPQEISGTVTGDGGELLKDFTLLVFPQERERWVFDSRLIATARSDRDGRYKLRTLPPGRYLAVPLDQSVTIATQDPDFLESQRTRATPFSLAEGEAKTLDLRVAPVR
jgi:hypothetical protein